MPPLVIVSELGDWKTTRAKSGFPCVSAQVSTVSDETIRCHDKSVPLPSVAQDPNSHGKEGLASLGKERVSHSHLGTAVKGRRGSRDPGPAAAVSEEEGRQRLRIECEAEMLHWLNCDSSEDTEHSRPRAPWQFSHAMGRTQRAWQEGL